MTMDVETFSRNPHPAYSALRESGAVCRVELPDGMPVWLVTRHAEARTVLTDLRLSKSARYAATELRPHLDRMFENAALSRTMFNVDPPEHTRLRTLAAKAFTPRWVESLRPGIQRICDDLLSAVAPLGGTDLMATYAQPLPATVIAELLGIPEQDRRQFLGFIHFPSDLNVSATTEQVAEGWLWLNRYFKDLVSARREDPGDDLVSAMLAARDGHDRLTDNEVRTMTFLFLLAGYETTVNLIAGGVLELLRRPERLSGLRTGEELPMSVVEELLRFDSPVKLIVYRYATEDLVLGETYIRAGDCVLVAVDAANHDPRRFPDPANLDLGRDAAGHVAFGHGRHLCLGAPLARLEAQVAIGTLVNSFEGLALAVPTDDLEWHPSVLVRRLNALPVTFKPS